MLVTEAASKRHGGIRTGSRCLARIFGHGAVVPELHAAGHRAHSPTVWELVDKQRVSAEQRMDVHDLFDLLIACWM
jgi:hypothetical protein